MPRVFCLTVHADYQCRHAGACCQAGWPIPLEPALQSQLDRAQRAGRLVVPLREAASDACIYHERPTDGAIGGGRCAIHRQLGEAYKPASCRQFPKVALLDGRGVSLTLSHYCPTAASMLFRTDVSLGVTEDAPAFPTHAEYEGLDARGVLPPLLRPAMLWDLEGYTAWEHHAVALLARDDLAPEHALRMLKEIAEAIERWAPSEGPLSGCVRTAFAHTPSRFDGTSIWGEWQRAIRNYLAARLFASWVPYRSERLVALIDDVSRAHDILLAEAARSGISLIDAIRAADLRVVHARW